MDHGIRRLHHHSPDGSRCARPGTPVPDGAAFIQKPFTLEVLEDRVTKTLEQSTRTVMNA
jgi:hypothetical protein